MALIEIIQKKQGNMTDIELYNALKKRYENLSFIIFNKIMMKLEIEGKIRSFNLTKNKRGVELVCN